MPEAAMSAKQESSSLYERAEKAARIIRARARTDVSVAVILGSGLGAFADELSSGTAIPYNDIPGFARATVEGTYTGGRMDALYTDPESKAQLELRRRE